MSDCDEAELNERLFELSLTVEPRNTKVAPKFVSTLPAFTSQTQYDWRLIEPLRCQLFFMDPHLNTTLSFSRM